MLVYIDIYIYICFIVFFFKFIFDVIIEKKRKMINLHPYENNLNQTYTLVQVNYI